jgi:hypothetical protein
MAQEEVLTRQVLAGAESEFSSDGDMTPKKAWSVPEVEGLRYPKEEPDLEIYHPEIRNCILESYRKSTALGLQLNQFCYRQRIKGQEV